MRLLKGLIKHIYICVLKLLEIMLFFCVISRTGLAQIRGRASNRAYMVGMLHMPSVCELTSMRDHICRNRYLCGINIIIHFIQARHHQTFCDLVYVPAVPQNKQSSWKLKLSLEHSCSVLVSSSVIYLLHLGISEGFVCSLLHSSFMTIIVHQNINPCWGYSNKLFIILLVDSSFWFLS
jgi:hypothetical protein